MKIRLPIFALLTAAVVSAYGQTVLPYKRVTNIPCKPIDTRTMFPQINVTYRSNAETPENPHNWTAPNDPPNNLVAGGLLNESRGTTGVKFPGIEATGSFPPDPDLAVGENQIVAVVNSDIAFFNKDGTRTFLQPSTTFFSGLGAGSFQFDPKAFYDRINKRFVLMFLELTGNESMTLLAVSDDDNPNGTWFRYRIDNSLDQNGNRFWSDYPGFGYNADAYCMTGNMFPFASGGVAGVQFCVYPITPLLSGQPATAEYVLDDTAFTVQLTENYSGSRFLYGVTRSGNASLRLKAINTASANALTSATVSVPAFSTPNRDAQTTSGQTMDSLDGRIFTAGQVGQRVVASHAIMAGSFIGSRWYEINLNGWPSSGTPALSQAGTVSNPAQDYHMPAVATNAVGDISMIFSGSSNTVTADINYAGRFPTDPAGTMGIPVKLEGSLGNNYRGFRWGDYFGVDVDPKDDLTFWGIGMKVRSDNNWTTTINSWNITPIGLTGLSVTPNPLSVGLSGSGVVTLRDPQPTATTVTLSATPNGILTIPASITIPAGNTSANFSCLPRSVSDTTNVTLTADAGILGKRSTVVRVTPITVREPLEIWGARVPGGNQRTCIVYLTGPAPAGGATVYLSTSNENLASPERNWVLIPEGLSSLRFKVNTKPVNSPTVVYVKATRAGITVQNDLQLQPAGVNSIEPTSRTVSANSNVSTTLYLDAPAPSSGAQVQLRSSDTARATVPSSVTVPAGSRSVTFNISVKAATSPGSVTITGTRLSSSKSVTLTINP